MLVCSDNGRVAATAREVAAMPHLQPAMSELLARVAEKLCQSS